VALPPSSTAASAQASALAAHPLLWRARQVSHRLDTVGTGHAALDQVLPGNGWPTGALTELVIDAEACGELSLLLPVLARLSHENHWITMIDPPWIPCPSALYGNGLAVEKLLLVRTQNKKESLWASEQAVRGIFCGAMLAWPDAISFSELRRLQLAARATRTTVFMFRDPKALNSPSPATLRLRLTPDNGDLQVRVLKCRGQRPASVIHIRRPQLLQPLRQPPVSFRGSDKRKRTQSEKPVVSLATSPLRRPSL